MPNNKSALSLQIIFTIRILSKICPSTYVGKELILPILLTFQNGKFHIT